MVDATGLSYDDVLVVPQRSPVDSRDDVDLTTRLADIELPLPVLSAPMDTVTETEMARAVGEAGGMGVIHRFTPPERQAEMVSAVADDGLRVGGAVGVDESVIDRAAALVSAGVSMLVLDVAHGHMERALATVETLAAQFSQIPLCAGNVATAAGVGDLAAAGADVVKVGVGPGSHCTTREVAGVGVPQFTAVREAADAGAVHGVATIADGGIQTSGDSVKAVLAGADAVMMGGFFADCTESPAGVVEIDGERYKQTHGMSTAAAAATREDKESTVEAEEGVEATVPVAGPVAPRLAEFTAGMRSGLSYVGAHDLATARERAEFIEVTPTTARRNGAHGVTRED